MADSAEEEKVIARKNFELAVATNQYWAVVDAQSDLEGWIDEYYSDETVSLDDPIIFGRIEVQVRQVNNVEWEEEGAGEATKFGVFICEENKSTSLKEFMKALLAFTQPLAANRQIGLNIYHLKEASDGVFHLFMGD